MRMGYKVHGQCCDIQYNIEEKLKCFLNNTFNTKFATMVIFKTDLFPNCNYVIMSWLQIFMKLCNDILQLLYLDFYVSFIYIRVMVLLMQILQTLLRPTVYTLLFHWLQNQYGHSSN